MTFRFKRETDNEKIRQGKRDEKRRQFYKACNLKKAGLRR